MLGGNYILGAFFIGMTDSRLCKSFKLLRKLNIGIDRNTLKIITLKKAAKLRKIRPSLGLRCNSKKEKSFFWELPY